MINNILIYFYFYKKYIKFFDKHLNGFISIAYI